METRSQPGAVPLYPLIARDSELEALVRIWRQSRLVTLYGQAGVGKSALARAAAERVVEGTPVAVIHLDADGIAGRLPILRLLARARRRHPLRPGHSLHQTDPPSGITASAVDSPPGDLPLPPPLFVLLDHLATAAHDAARGIVQWLVEHPEAHLLVVSRQPLQVLGEQSLCLAPLSLTGSAAAAAPAAQLFAWIAGRGDEPANGSDRAQEICAALDGHPAAIEAAAALAGALPAEEIARIAREDPLSLSLRGIPLHRVLQATWDDLPPEARQYLRTNAVWPASFRGRAAEHLAGVPGSHPVTAALVRMGLLRLTSDGREPRFRLSPLIRRWALSEPAEDADTRLDRMARWLAEEVVRTAPSHEAWDRHPEDAAAARWAWRWLAGRRDGVSVTRIALALAGPLRRHLGEPGEALELLRSALAWSRVEATEQSPALLSHLAATERVLGHLERAEERLRGLLAAPLPARERVSARLRRAAVLSDRGQHAAALELRREAVVDLRESGPDGAAADRSQALAWALHGQAVDSQALGQSDAARASLGEAAALFDETGCPYGRAACHALFALLHADAEEWEEAAWYAREALAQAEAVADRPGLARALQALARAVASGDPPRALALVEKAGRVWRQVGQPAGLIRSRLQAAELTREAGGTGYRLIQPVREALSLARRRGYHGLTAASLVTLAEVYQRMGRVETARDYWQQARAACDQTDGSHVRRQCEALGAALRPPQPQRQAPRSASQPARPEHLPAATAGPPLQLRLLGAVQVEGPNGVLAADRLRPKEQRILARLGLQPGRVVPRDELLDTFWAGSKMALAERSLRTVVSSLRHAIHSVLDEPALPLVRGRMDGYCLEEAAFSVDVSQFVEAVQEARARSDGDLPSAPALAAWQRAVDLYRGDLLSAFRYDDWCLAIRERLRDDYLDALFQLARAALARGELEPARGLAARMVELEPAEERAHRLLMRCYGLLGRPAEAVRQFERCRAALDEELAARPTAATIALLEEIRSGAPGLLLDEAGERAASP